MSRVPGARFDRGAPHEQAMDWAAEFVRAIDQLGAKEIRAAWNRDPAMKHRAQLKETGPDALRQLVYHVKWRLGDLERLSGA
ncbi:MAG TPA: hypothetical protein VJP88_08605 [Caulobacteraceae bacterium]|nr:hypothetical protein [Caulobacteraceae bacterium]